MHEDPLAVAGEQRRDHLERLGQPALEHELHRVLGPELVPQLGIGDGRSTSARSCSASAARPTAEHVRRPRSHSQSAVAVVLGECLGALPDLFGLLVASEVVERLTEQSPAQRARRRVPGRARNRSASTKWNAKIACSAPSHRSSGCPPPLSSRQSATRGASSVAACRGSRPARRARASHLRASRAIRLARPPRRAGAPSGPGGDCPRRPRR